MLGVLLGLLFPLITFGSLAIAIVYGPFKHRFWRRETVAGFTLTVAWIAFLVGFVGPMIVAPGANQGPLLGIFYTGPAGIVVGLIWALRRKSQHRQTV
jgi:hypothetical protein